MLERGLLHAYCTSIPMNLCSCSERPQELCPCWVPLLSEYPHRVSHHVLWPLRCTPGKRKKDGSKNLARMESSWSMRYMWLYSRLTMRVVSVWAIVGLSYTPSGTGCRGRRRMKWTMHRSPDSVHSLVSVFHTPMISKQNGDSFWKGGRDSTSFSYWCPQAGQSHPCHYLWAAASHTHPITASRPPRPTCGPPVALSSPAVGSWCAELCEYHDRLDLASTPHCHCTIQSLT